MTHQLRDVLRNGELQHEPQHRYVYLFCFTYIKKKKKKSVSIREDQMSIYSGVVKGYMDATV